MKYVLDKKLPYDIFLMRPWIHPMRCIPSTLYRLINFNHNGKKYVFKVVEKSPDLIAQVGNTIVPYRNVEIHEENGEHSEENEEDSDTM